MLTTYQKKILRAFAEWVSFFCTPEDYFCLSVRGKEYFFAFDFPLKVGARPKRIASRDIAGARFVLSLEEGEHRHTFFSNFGLKLYFKFHSVAVFEAEKQFEERQLKTEDREWLLKTAREALVHGVRYGSDDGYKPAKISSYRLLKTRNIAAALWLNGRLHGSQIVLDQHLYEGVTQAVIRSIYDERFSPIALSDVDAIRIELTVFDSLCIPLDKKMLHPQSHKGAIGSQKGYMLKNTVSGRSEYFLPEVFNVLSFSNLHELFKSLAHTKFKEELSNAYTFFAFETDVFIESTQFDVLSLRGPLCWNDAIDTLHEEHKLARCAGEWILSLQREDGYIPPFVEVVQGVTHHADWPRVAFVCGALHVYGEYIGGEVYLESAYRLYTFLKQEVKRQHLSPAIAPLTFAYLGQAAYRIGDITSAKSLLHKSMSALQRQPFDPISYAQGTMLAKMLRGSDEALEQQLQEMKSFLKEQFEIQVSQPNFNVVAWAELVNVFYGEDEGLVNWLGGCICDRQANDGSFYIDSSQEGHFSAKGVAKLFEALSLISSTSREQQKVLAWLSLMQYNEQNVYHIPAAKAKLFEGGFREDYLDRTAWIDTAGHLLLGVSRRAMFDADVAQNHAHYKERVMQAVKPCLHIS